MNKWRKEHPELIPDLAGIETLQNPLAGSDLAGIDLSRAIVSSARLVRVFLYEADLSNADLRSTYFGLSDLSWADLQGAQLSGADFTAANLSFVRLDGSDLTNTKMGWTILGSLDFGNVRGLGTIRHWRPSVLDVETIYASRTHPRSVLARGRTSRKSIRFAASLVGVPFVAYSCFISYSTEDQEFAQRLCFDLQERGIRCWFAKHDIQVGKKIHEQIETAIRVYDRLLLILSNASMSSEWVKTEIPNARQREVREKRRMLFPISLVRYDRISRSGRLLKRTPGRIQPAKSGNTSWH